MQFKPVPEPLDDLEALEYVVRTVPAHPAEVDDCCAHLVTETDLETRDEAATWLTFLRALELVEETGAGYRRRSPEGGLEIDRLRQGFRERVSGADAVLEVLDAGDRPLAGDEVARRAAGQTDHGRVSRRQHRSSTTDSGAERVERLLDWAVLFDRLERVDDRYRPR